MRDFFFIKIIDPQGDWIVPRRDIEYLRVLNLSEVRHHRHDLRRLASTGHPGVPLHDLIIVIDYSVVPTTRRVDLYSAWSRLFTVPRKDSATYAIGIVPHEDEDLPKYHITIIPSYMWDPFMDPLMSQGDEDAEARRRQYGDV